MTWQIGSVTLPKSPAKISYDAPALYEGFSHDGEQSDVLGDGLDLETMTWTVELAMRGSTLSDMITDYVTPLKTLRGTTVTLTTPYALFNGTWLHAGITPDFDNQDGERLTCRLKFVKGGTIEIL